jgi:hypothetical protein
LEVEKLKKKEIASDTFPIQKSFIFLKSTNIHSFGDGGSTYLTNKQALSTSESVRAGLMSDEKPFVYTSSS